jgi:phosphate transport system protein
MDRQFQNQLDEIKSLLLSMGGEVEKSLETAIEGVLNRNAKCFEKVFEIEKRINEHQIQVDQVCASFLAKQGPVATDLRLVLSVLKINADLERMGDYCVTISYFGQDLMKRNRLPAPADIRNMARIAKRMVKDSLDAFVRRDEAMGQSVISSDTELDDLKEKVIAQLKQEVRNNVENLDDAFDFMFIAKNLERIGDHATNVAEDVIYVSSGKDIRHGHY